MHFKGTVYPLCLSWFFVSVELSSPSFCVLCLLAVSDLLPSLSFICVLCYHQLCLLCYHGFVVCVLSWHQLHVLPTLQSFCVLCYSNSCLFSATNFLLFFLCFFLALCFKLSTVCFCVLNWNQIHSVSSSLFLCCLCALCQ